jgi:hypothetical protein
MALAFVFLAAAGATAGPITHRDSTVLATLFPFDTLVCSVCGLGPLHDSVGIDVQRYEATLYFCWRSHPAACPTSQRADFELPLNYPRPSDGLPLVVKNIGGDCYTCTYDYYLDREYLVPIDSISLYLRVLAADSTSLQLRFDTVSTAVGVARFGCTVRATGTAGVVPRLVVMAGSGAAGADRVYVRVGEGKSYDLRGRSQFGRLSPNGIPVGK